MRWVGCVAALVAGVLLASCRFIPTAEVPALASAGAENGAGPFDPDKMVASIWSSKVVPYFEKKAGPFARSPRRWPPSLPTRRAPNSAIAPSPRIRPGP